MQPLIQPNTAMFQAHLPNSPCYVPAISVSAAMQPYVTTITGLVMYNLQVKAGTSPFRAFMFNLMSQHGYQNQEFGELVKFVADASEYYMIAQRVAPSQAIGQAVEDLVTWMMAVRVLQNHQSLAMFLDVQAVTDFQVFAEQARNLRNAITALASGQVAHNMTLPAAAGMPVMQQALGVNPGQHPGFGAGGLMGPVYAAAVNADTAPQRPSTVTQPTIAPVPYNQITPAVPLAQPATPSVMNTHLAQASVPTPVTEFDATAINKWSQMLPTPNEIKEIREVQPAEVAAARPFDVVPLYDDTVAMPAHQNPELPRTWSVTSPHGLAIDPVTHMLNLTVDVKTNRVQHIATEWTDDMDYLKHELNPELRHKEMVRREVMSGKRVAYSTHQILDLQPEPEKNLSLHPVDYTPPAPSEPYKLDDVVVMERTGLNVHNSIPEAIRAARDLLREEGRPGMAKRSTEVYCDIPTVVMVPDDTAEAVRLLGQSETLDALHAAMEGVAALLSEEALFALDGCATQLVNDTMVQRFGLDITIDSFLGDWNDLAKLLSNTYGADVTAVIENKMFESIETAFNALDDETASNVLAVIIRGADEAEEEAEEVEDVPEQDPEDVADYVADPNDELADLMAEEAEEDQLLTQTPVVFNTRVSVTTVPVTREDLDLDLTHGALVVQELLPGLHAACSAILKRTGAGYRNRYILTRDGKLLEINTSLLVPDTILLYDVTL